MTRPKRSSSSRTHSQAGSTVSYSKDLFGLHKEKLDAYLVSLIQEERQFYVRHHWADELFTYLETFLQRGKSIRGVLVMQLADLLDSDASAEDVLPLAAYVELVHAGLLIQDDIMDKDSVRRGLPTLHTTYKQYGRKREFLDADLFGKSLAICVSDICFFAGFKEFSKLSTDPKLSSESLQKLLLFANQEYIHVGFAQLQDVHLANIESLMGENGTKSAIETIYLYKTARYTFSLPLGLAARYCGLSSEVTRQLEAIGDTIGLLFQIRDDYLALFGEEAVTGKPVGTDITENKHTIYKLHLLEALEQAQAEKIKQKILPLFGTPQLSPEQITFVQETLLELGVVNDIDQYCAELISEVETLLATSDLNSAVTEFLSWLAEFVMTRKK